MSFRLAILAASVGGAILAATAATPAAALSMKECSTKYDAAKTAGTLNGQKWNDFRKAQCGADATAAAPAAAPAAAAAAPAAPATAAPTAAAQAPAAAPANPLKPAPAAKPAAPAAAPAAPAATGAAVFPSAIAPQYSTLSAGKARMKTCDDQYKANKATNGNGGLKWIEKGGGYYSECNKRLKGA